MEATLSNEDKTSQQEEEKGTYVSESKIEAHSHDADEALKAFGSSTGEVVTIDAATNKRLLRLIDWNLMPASTHAIGEVNKR
jgi:hypothetical protein